MFYNPLYKDRNILDDEMQDMWLHLKNYYEVKSIYQVERLISKRFNNYFLAEFFTIINPENIKPDTKISLHCGLVSNSIEGDLWWDKKIMMM